MFWSVVYGVGYLLMWEVWDWNLAYLDYINIDFLSFSSMSCFQAQSNLQSEHRACQVLDDRLSEIARITLVC